MDVVQKVRDLTNLALDGGTSVDERLQAAVAALRLVDRFLLPKGKKEVAADLLKKIMAPDFAEGIASHAEKFADGFDRALGSAGRVLGSVKRVTDHLSQSSGDAAPSRGKKRRYSGR